ncbi:hypothetical protein [Hydrogenimonas thermophila]|uniref:Uncharacterized protein n=1 Tax=Hydrogenimonas thermophila TaxID=223786 RepID=A0A1I5Q4G0_9BACT|nr:hypothetical protein [Hydrogenimonas thermophila]WOE70369.1 hypothetical protein RZR91_02075 [Hydrogenimonas thermophila]WOE72884.1 hypothetical protein RZR97_02055 [Hydrogenimonas thermophila]SFP41067.1 hypothetical protein SAMN05216234_11831 [Hydrogenimonas thermophila]
MKGIGKIITMLFLVSVAIFVVKSKAEESSIDVQIEQIKNADPLKRRELMNKFKEQLATMNRKERVEALRKLLGKMQVKNRENVVNQLIDTSLNNTSTINRQTETTNPVHRMPRQPMGSGNMQMGHQHR